MSYRMYIAYRKRQKDKEKIKILKEDILPSMINSEEYKDFFLNAELLKRLGFSVCLELGNENVADTILLECESYIPNDVINIFPNYLPHYPKDEKYIGILTKELLLKYIRMLHQSQIDYLKGQYQACNEDSRYAQNYAKNVIANQLVDYQTSIEYLQSSNIPYCIKNDFRFLIFQLHELFCKTNFDETELVIYGW